MTSPTETHAELDAERRAKLRRERVELQLVHLTEMVRGPGFGLKDSHIWAESEAARHLEAAYQLLLMENHRR